MIDSLLIIVTSIATPLRRSLLPLRRRRRWHAAIYDAAAALTLMPRFDYVIFDAVYAAALLLPFFTTDVTFRCRRRHTPLFSLFRCRRRCYMFMLFSFRYR